MSTGRVLEFSATPVHLRYRNGLLVIQRESLPETTVPLEDVAVMVVSHQQATATAALISEFAKTGGVVVFSDAKHMPVGLLLPTVGHSTQQERYQAQANAPVPLRKRLWRQIVQAKLLAQGSLLQEVLGDDLGLRRLSTQVRSGDPANLEALAAQRYWRAVFSAGQFRRRQDENGPNAMLNYGYAILRACTARSICAAGLHPSLGVHHCNRYDAFCLADDLMEPFRPLVDSAVVELVNQRGIEAEFDRDARVHILTQLTGRFSGPTETRTLFDWLSIVASSLAQVYLKVREQLDLPEIRHVKSRKEPVSVPSHVADGDVRSAG